MFDTILKENFNDLFKALMTSGHAVFEKDGLKIVATSNGTDNVSITCTYSSPEDNKLATLKANFDKFVSTMSDDFFAEVCDSYKNESLEMIQQYIQSNEPAEVLMGIQDFLAKTKYIAKKKIAAIDEEILAKTEERNHFVGILNFNF